ncbi:MAG: helix-turn-helix transcriptional regulator [Polyangiaceae bacterium]
MVFPVEIAGVQYHTLAEVLEITGITRQTLWRWRRESKVPAGHRYRDKQLLYTRSELLQIQTYANRLQPEMAQRRGETP